MGRPKLDLQGVRSGRLTVTGLAPAPSGAGYYAMWECICDCGNTVVKRSSHIKAGISTSCGCLTREDKVQRSTTHGLSQTKTYWIWHNMKHRCSDKNHPSWPNYGGRGIKVCDRWLDSVENFISDMGIRPANMELDRINADGDYCLENCRWVSRKTNMNNKRNNHRLQYGGENLTLTEWSERTGLKMNTIRGRVLLGWSAADALTKPLTQSGGRRPAAQDPPK